MKAARDGSTRWCAGLPQTGERELSVDEAARLRSEELKGQRVFLGLVLVYPALFLVLLAALALMEPQSGFAGAVPIILVIPIFGCLAAVILRAREARIRSRGLRGDLRQNEVMRFSGMLADGDPENETQRHLLRKRFLAVGALEAQSIEVLPVSRRILSANGRALNEWVSAAWTDTAATPAFAAMAAEWLQPVAVTEDAEVYSGHRELSAGERGEIRGIVMEMRRPLWPTILLTVWFILLSGGYALFGRTPGPVDFYRILALGILALGSDLIFLFRLLRARRLAADARQGIVVILRISTTAVDPDQQPEAPREFEILPHSRAIWTERGKPASWRTSDTWLRVPRRVPK